MFTGLLRDTGGDATSGLIMRRAGARPAGPPQGELRMTWRLGPDTDDMPGPRIHSCAAPAQQASTARMRRASAISFLAVADGMVFPDWAFTSVTKVPSVRQASAT